jgi:hypothetical protein
MLSVSTLSRKGFFQFINLRTLSKADAFALGRQGGAFESGNSAGTGNNPATRKQSIVQTFFIMLARPYQVTYAHKT